MHSSGIQDPIIDPIVDPLQDPIIDPLQIPIDNPLAGVAQADPRDGQQMGSTKSGYDYATTKKV